MKLKNVIFALLFCISIQQTSFAQKTILSKPATLNHIAYYVADLKIASDFYHHFFDLKEIANPFNDGKHTWFRLSKRSALHIIAGAKTKGNYFIEEHVCFSVPDIEEFIKKLKNKNISYMSFNKVKNEVTQRADGVHQIYLQDPDGHWLEVNDAKR
ncbi:VOC family protein [Pedobacter sp. Du54]|uniref:VOC family protein n=1 Tax=Pedobacter anseongensis TaxID=3133439 RepID=UPI0030AFC76A